MAGLPGDSVQDAFDLLVKEMEDFKPPKLKQIRVPRQKLEAALNTARDMSNTSSHLTTEEQFSMLASSMSEDNETNSMDLTGSRLDDTFGSMSRQIYLNSIHLPSTNELGIDNQFIYPQRPDFLDEETFMINQKFAELAASCERSLDTQVQDNSQVNSSVETSPEDTAPEPQNSQCFDKENYETDRPSHKEQIPEMGACAILNEKDTSSENTENMDTETECQSRTAAVMCVDIAKDPEQSSTQPETKDIPNQSTGVYQKPIHRPVAFIAPQPICESSDEAYDSDTSGILNETLDSMKAKMMSRKPQAMKKTSSVPNDLSQATEMATKTSSKAIDNQNQQNDSQSKVDKVKDRKVAIKEFQAMRAKIWSQQIEAINRKPLTKYMDNTKHDRDMQRKDSIKNDHKNQRKVAAVTKDHDRRYSTKSKTSPSSVSRSRSSSTSRSSKRIPSGDQNKGYAERPLQRTLGTDRELLDKQKKENDIKEKTQVRDSNGKTQHRRKDELRASYKSRLSVRDPRLKEKHKREHVEKRQLRGDNVRLLTLEKNHGHCSEDDFCPENRKSFASLSKAQQIKRLKELLPARSKTTTASRGVKLNDTVLATKNLDALSSLDKKAKAVTQTDSCIPERVGILLEANNPIHAGGIWNSLNNIVSE